MTELIREQVIYLDAKPRRAEDDLRIRRCSSDTLQKKEIHLSQFKLEQRKRRAKTC